MILTPAMVLVSAAGGVVEASMWLVSGLADTLTGGYFALAPAFATELSFAPAAPWVATGQRRLWWDDGAHDACGRPLTTGDHAG